MSVEAIERELLVELYNRFFGWTFGGLLDYNRWIRERKYRRALAQRALDDLHKEGLISVSSSLQGVLFVDLTVKGVHHVEAALLVPPELVKRARQVRQQILQVLADAGCTAETSKALGSAAICTAASITPQELSDQLHLLSYYKMGYVAPRRDDQYYVTAPGLEELEDLAEQLSLASEFGQLRLDKAATPQQRGYRLEALLQEVIAAAGWRCDRNVRAEGEEHDLVIRSGHEYYLGSCKWEKRPVDAGRVREFMGRLTDRVAVNGIYFSMSGFNDAARKYAERSLSQRMVLLFGAADITALLSTERFFPDLLDEKYKLAITHRQLAFS